MTYSPINVDTYTNAYAGALAGMAVSGWIIDPNSADYANVAAIAGAFAEAFDTIWNNSTALNSLQSQAIQSVCQEQFRGHAPGSLDNLAFAQAANWATPAAACAALVLEGDAYVNSQGITPTTPGGTFAPIFHQLWLDTTKAAGGNGSIGTPFNSWADTMGQLAGQGALFPWLINLAQDIDASGTPVPNFVGGGHDAPQVKFQGVVATSVFSAFGTGLSGLVFDHQDSGNLTVEFDDLLVSSVTFTDGTVTMLGNNSLISTVGQTGTVSGTSYLINCSVNLFTLDSWDLKMTGGTVDLPMSINNGFLDDVEFLDSLQLRWAGSLNLSNCRFRAGGQLLCASNNQLNLDLTSWGSMVAAGITFPDTFPQMTITPWVPVIGSKAVVSTDSIGPNAVATLDVGVMAPQEAEKNTSCIVNFHAAVNTNMVVVGAFIDANRHLNVLVKNLAGTSQNLVNPTYTVTYLPRLSP